MFLFLLLILCSVAFGEYELAAVALLKSTDTTCIATNGDIEYWVNMATSAHSATKIMATDLIEMSTLNVRGHLDVSGNKVDISVSTVAKDVSITGKLSTRRITDVDVEIVTNTERIQSLESTLSTLESRIKALEESKR
jgi:hypothetical protein